MKTKIFIFFLALAASVGSMSASTKIGDLYYNLDAQSKTAEVTYQVYNSGDNYIELTIAIIPTSVSYQSVTYNVTSIGNSAFASTIFFSRLTNVIIPNSVTSIGDYAFYGCSSLTSIDIPNSVTSIGGSAFRDCSSLTSIEIPNSVTSIGDYAFYGCGITSVTIPNSVTSIGERAFQACRGLTSIEIPNSVTNIGDYAFYECSSLTSIKIPNSVTSIGDYAFVGCSSLTSVALPNSITNIGVCAFYRCSSLTSLTIPNSVTSIGNGAFNECSSLTSIEIPNSVTSIGDYAFYHCSSLTSIEIPNNVTSIGNGAFQACSGLTSIEIPNSVTSIEGYAFSECSSLTSVTIPNSVTSIGERAFQACSGLTSIEIPNSVTSIGDAAFYECSSLTSIEIPNSVTSIGEVAFYRCSSLTSITCDAVTPPTLDYQVFYRVEKSIPLYVPVQSIDLYKAADQWKEFTNILPISGTETEKFTITWQDEEGNVIKTDEVASGETPAYSGATPTKASTAEYTYEFAGWLPKIKPATEDVHYTTFFERNKIETPKYTVNINGENCSLRISNEVPAGTMLQVEAVADECFEFQKWSDNETATPRTLNVTEDANLTAEFNKLQYTITGKNDAEGGQVNVEEVNP